MVGPGEACITNEEYLQHFRIMTAQERIPVTASLDLTQRCNLKCVHCYVGPQSPDQRQRELSTAELRRIIDEFTEAGCLFLLMTGGEVLLREDFGEIYRHAKTNGLLVTVFTNGTLVGDRLLELFSDLPPREVEITLYGATAGTHESITGVKGSHRRCLAGLKQLLEHGINVRLKTILMTLNRHEFFQMEVLAEEAGVRFRFDAALFPRLNGDKAPLSLRVAPEEAIAKEFSNKEKVRQWKEFFQKYRGASISDEVYQCAAGRTSFHIDASGNLKPCMMTTNLEFSLQGSVFRDEWKKLTTLVREKRTGSANCCKECKKKVLCGYCPPFFELETGSEDVFSEYLCAMGRLRMEVIEREFGLSLTELAT
jgi:radical SAM protein with 4Fe4S-binding SPASM domain